MFLSQVGSGEECILLALLSSIKIAQFCASKTAFHDAIHFTIFGYHLPA